jgi:hypothetical protein
MASLNKYFDQKSAPEQRNLSNELNSLMGYTDQFNQTSNQSLNNYMAQGDQFRKGTADFLRNSSSPRTRQALQSSQEVMWQSRQPTSLHNAIQSDAQAKLNYTSPILSQLNNQAMGDLSLGRSLSPEEEMIARQQALAGAASRGMSNGAGALAGEVLNRNQFANQRQNERRTFASGVEQLGQANSTANRGYAMNADLAELERQKQMANTTYYNANLQMRGDPAYMASEIAGNYFTPSLTASQNNTNSLLNYGSDLYNTNFNAQQSNYNAFLNYLAANEGNQMTAASSRDASNKALIGSGIQAAGTIGGAALGSFGGPVGTMAGGAAGGALSQMLAKSVTR